MNGYEVCDWFVNEEASKVNIVANLTNHILEGRIKRESNAIVNSY